MNEPIHIEAARKLAERALSAGHNSTETELAGMFRRVLARWPTDKELAVISELFDEYQSRFATEPTAAEQLLSIGESPRDGSFDIADHAALTAVANLLLNLDETLTLE